MSKKIFENKYFWWGLGLIIVLIATSVEVFRGRNTNYFDYQDSTRMFWEGLSPYNLEYVQAHQIYFLYSPVFSVLFAPIFYLPWWLGPYIWNIGNYTLFSLAIKWLPQQLEKYKLYIFIFLLSVVLQTVFCYQHNIIVAYIYLFAFILLERGKGFWAVFSSCCRQRRRYTVPPSLPSYSAIPRHGATSGMPHYVVLSSCCCLPLIPISTMSLCSISRCST